MTNFSVQQAKSFKKLFAHSPVSTGFGVPEKFLLQYILFEALVRLVWSYYRDRTNQKKKSNAHVSLNIEVVRRSFLYFNIRVSDERLDLLLNSNLTKRNEKSARNLRNGLAHHWKIEDANEVKTRYKALSSALTGAINAIRARIDSVA